MLVQPYEPYADRPELHRSRGKSSLRPPPPSVAGARAGATLSDKISLSGLSDGRLVNVINQFISNWTKLTG